MLDYETHDNNCTAVVSAITGTDDCITSIVHSGLIRSCTPEFVVKNLLEYVQAQTNFDKIVAEITLYRYSDRPITYEIEIYKTPNVILVKRFCISLLYLDMITLDFVSQIDEITPHDEYFFNLLKSFVGTVLVTSNDIE